jgi:hypothetical protein
MRDLDRLRVRTELIISRFDDRHRRFLTKHCDLVTTSPRDLLMPDER